MNNVKVLMLALTDKIPDVEFYIDQRDLVRKFAIGARPSNKANKRRAELEEKDKKRQKKVEQSKIRLHNYEMEKSASNEQNYLDFDPSDEESVGTNRGDVDSDFIPTETKSSKKRCLFNTSRRTHHRYRHSDRSSVACINSALIDIKRHLLETGENFLDIVDDLMVDRTSIRNWNKKDRLNYISEHSETNKNFECLKFDGKISKTLISPNVF